MDIQNLCINPKRDELLDFNSADLLKCGSCSTEFLLSDILVFIQHKSKQCKLEKSSFEDKENFLKCSNCPESFGNANSLLEHAQFIHKIDIFLENSKSPSPLPISRSKFGDSSRANTNTGGSKYSSNNPNESSKSNNGALNNNSGSGKFNSKNEIFIDLIPGSSSDHSQMRYPDRVLGEYNITVSSSSNQKSSVTYYTPNDSNKNNRVSISSNENNPSQFKFTECLPNNSCKVTDCLKENLMDNNDNENTSSSSDSNQTSSRFEEQINTNKDSNSSINELDKIGCNQDDYKTNSHISDENKQRKQQKPTATFYCDVCKAAFNQKIHLTKHSAKHTGIKPFKCTECNYSTVERSHLKVHVRVHTGEKPFKCTFCEYATAQSSTLKIHKKRHHDKIESSASTFDINNNNTVSSQPPSVDSREDLSHNYTPLQDENPRSLPQTSSKNDENDDEMKQTTSDTSTTITLSNDTLQQEEKRNFNFDFIYKNKKNLPPTKRFKNYSDTNDLVKSSSPNEEKSNSSMKLEENSFSPDDDEPLVIDVDKSSPKAAANTQSSDSTIDNKLLDLAKIALERETN